MLVSAVEHQCQPDVPLGSKLPARRDLPPCDKRVNIPPVSLMSEAWKESNCSEGKDSSCLDDVETTCPCKFLSQTHCSPRGQSKQACQTQLASHYRRTMAPCVWGPTKTFPCRPISALTGYYPLKRLPFYTSASLFSTVHFLLFFLCLSFRSMSPQSHLHWPLTVSTPRVSWLCFIDNLPPLAWALEATCAIFFAENKTWKADGKWPV